MNKSFVPECVGVYAEGWKLLLGWRERVQMKVRADYVWWNDLGL